jgi:hypothetical protein
VVPVLRRHRLTRPRQPAFAAGHQARYPPSYSWNRPVGGPAPVVPLSCCLSAGGLRFLGVLFPPRDWALLTVGLPPRPSGRGGPDGVLTFRTHETRPGRVPSLPRRRRCPRDHRIVLGRRLPTLSGWPLVTPAPRPDPGSCRNEASARVYWYSPCRPSPHPWPPDGAGALRLSPELRTRPLLATHVRAGTGLGHGPGATSSAWPNLQST